MKDIKEFKNYSIDAKLNIIFELILCLINGEKDNILEKKKNEFEVFKKKEN